LINLRGKKIIGLVIATVFLAVYWLTPVHELTNIPETVRIVQGHAKTIPFGLPATASIQSATKPVALLNGATSTTVPVHSYLEIVSKRLGEEDVVLKLFGVVPIRSVHVSVLPAIAVIPGGQSIGVKLRASGILIVGYNLIREEDGGISPGEKADMKIGDVITAINGRPVQSVEQAAMLIHEAGTRHQPLNFTVMRQQQCLHLKVSPRFDKESNTYRIGLYIRDSAAGVGTLTFYDPQHHVYGALGHVITDVDTGQNIRVGTGKIVHSSVMSIDKGENGQPGEKRGLFVDEEHVLGDITKNTEFGIFGKMEQKPDHLLIDKPIPIALAEQVHEGPAKILTVVNGQRVESFDVEIVSVTRQKYPATKSMVIKVTDPRLLKLTGGIIQGMSGSPIIQDGKLAGAVTHVFVNDPTRGYGVYIEWMLNEAGIQTKPAVASI
jgi:stage IV sporulation protein B